MKCSQCEKEATQSGSELCKECEDEIIEEGKQQLKEDLANYYSEITNGIGFIRRK
jgi:hypothetical protein